eukprot:6196252-Pleurochrysis_carterae.AAC.1
MTRLLMTRIPSCAGLAVRCVLCLPPLHARIASLPACEAHVHLPYLLRVAGASPDLFGEGIDTVVNEDGE